jgi:hypothetical protein
MYLGTIYLSTEFRPDQTLPPGGHLGEKKTKTIAPELMTGSAPNFHHTYMYI